MSLHQSLQANPASNLSGKPKEELGTLNPIPKPRVNPPVFSLKQISPNDPALKAGAKQMVFYAAGDSGGPSTHHIELVGDAMASDAATNKPSCFLHLGDVMYGNHKDQEYLGRFYRPYNGFACPIIAIPGNHDGETKSITDPTSLRAFWANFCTATPQQPANTAQAGITRKTMDQPGVYWLFQTPLADIIGLYSNTGESGGTLGDGKGDTSQMDFLAQALTGIASDRKKGRKALILATHHPVYSSSGHSGSAQMLSEIDAACIKAGIYPDLFLAGHAHNSQSYSRKFTFKGSVIQVPYLVAGTAGYGLQAVAKPIGVTTQEPSGEVTYKQGLKTYGYLHITVTAAQIVATMRTVSEDGISSDFDTTTIPLRP